MYHTFNNKYIAYYEQVQINNIFNKIQINYKEIIKILLVKKNYSAKFKNL